MNSHVTCFQRGFIAQSVEHRTGIADVMGSIPIGASEVFLGFICNSLSYFISVRITFTFILLSAVHSCDPYNIHIIKEIAINGKQ